MQRRIPASVWLAAALTLLPTTSLAGVIDFEDLVFPPGEDRVNDSFGFTSGAGSFNNTFDDSFGFESWAGWSYSRETENSRPGGPDGDPGLFFIRQYASAPGGGVGAGGAPEPGGSYGIGFFDGFNGVAPRIDFDGPQIVEGGFFGNNAYAALSMANGDGFAKKFGGADGSDPDFFKLVITGLDAEGRVVGQVDFFLADFRSPDPAEDFIVEDWSWVPLSELGPVSGLELGFDSSDVGPFGINTPLYVALDDLSVAAVPEPTALGLFAAGLLAVRARSRRPRG